MMRLTKINNRILLHRIDKFTPGSIHKSNLSGYYRILEINNSIATIEFIKTKYIKKTSVNHLRSGVAKDPTYPRVSGVGYLGVDYTNIIKMNDRDFVKKLYSTWRNMLKRCYEKTHKNYKSYGGSGVSVHKSWHNFSTFFEEVQKLDGWDINNFMKNKITLDKDKYQQNVKSEYKMYSQDTCCWLSIYDQNKLIDFRAAHEFEMKKFIVYFPDGHLELHTGMSKFALDHGLTKTSMSKCLLGKQKSHKGYKFKLLND